jgi:transposase
MTTETEVGAVGAQAAIKARRGKWTEEQRRRIVAASRVAGASIQEVAHRHGVRPNLLSAWRGQAAKRPTVAAKVQFAAVRVNAALPPAPGSIEIDLNGGCIRVRGIVDAAMLREVLAAAR